jgi:hypothetical protein
VKGGVHGWLWLWLLGCAILREDIWTATCPSQFLSEWKRNKGRRLASFDGGLVQLNGWMVVTGADFQWIFPDSGTECRSFEPLTVGQK